MIQPVLQVSNLGKAYRQYSSQVARIASWFGLPVKPLSEHWVLREVSFSVAPGEAVGIVGQNGAGKSTLLKLVTGTQQPSRGNIAINGRVAAILELGMGFNPEFTGRQNAYHAVGLMGFHQGEIEAVMPDIEAFAEIGEYFDQPVHTYSSGMQMRVAFAVVTAFRPAILIVDEALSVGDAYFQHKSFNRIREFQKQGTTLLIVSHDAGAIQSLCDRAILLESGMVAKDGDPEEVLNYYNAIIADKENSRIEIKTLATGKVQTISGTREAEVDSIMLLNAQNEPAEVVNVGERVTLKVKIKANKKLPSLVLGYMIKNRFGQDVYGTNTWYTQQLIKDLSEGENLTYDIHFDMNLGPGNYSISTALISSNLELLERYEWCDLMCIFSVVNLDKIHFGGVAWIEPVFVINRDE